MTDLEIRPVRATISGIAPLLLHSAQTLDPLHELTKQIKAITNKPAGKKTDDDILALRKLEWEAGLYLHNDRIVMPTDNILGCIAKGAVAVAKGAKAKVLSGVFPFAAEGSDGDFWPIEFPGSKKPWRELYGDTRSPYVFAKRVVVKQSGVLRVRPRIPTPWSITFVLGTYPSVVGAAAIEEWLIAGGRLGGLCDFRPRYGRFVVEAFEPMEPVVLS